MKYVKRYACTGQWSLRPDPSIIPCAFIMKNKRQNSIITISTIFCSDNYEWEMMHWHDHIDHECLKCKLLFNPLIVVQWILFFTGDGFDTMTCASKDYRN